MDADERAAMRARHYDDERYNRGYCHGCGQEWDARGCDAIRALDALDASDAEPEPNDFFEEDEPIEDVRRAWQRSYEGGRTEGTQLLSPEEQRIVDDAAESLSTNVFVENYIFERAVPSEEQGEPPEPKLHKAWCMATHGKGECDCGEST